jgi:hypothetical protein
VLKEAVFAVFELVKRHDSKRFKIRVTIEVRDKKVLDERQQRWRSNQPNSKVGPSAKTQKIAFQFVEGWRNPSARFTGFRHAPREVGRN